MVEIESRSPNDTERIGAALARKLEIGDVVTVAGALGAGKTTLIRGACRALGVVTPVTSPTYTVGNRYSGRVDVSHLDLYRFPDMTERDWGDLEAYFDGAIAFVEWPDVAERHLPPARARLRLQLGDGDRRLVVVQSAEKPLEIAVSSSC